MTTIPQGGTGDVKYHHGAQGTYQCGDGDSVLVRLESNPSHLEYVGPVVEGATRAVQTSRQGTHATLDTNAAVPIILHGDAAFPGQGVVAETFNLQALDGYTVGGTLHLIQNNQVGFTTDPDDSRSTRWASDLAKGFDVPIFHVNADDVAACVSAVRLAFAFRQEFGHDVLIDLIGYRRYGHNEADEPAYTQPEMTAKIKAKKPVRELYAAHAGRPRARSRRRRPTRSPPRSGTTSPRRHRELKEQLAERGRRAADGRLRARPLGLAGGQDRGLDASACRRSTRSCCASPRASPCTRSWSSSSSAGATAIGPDGGIDWAQAESLAYASLLTEGTPVRLTGQDAERGTFSQRHLVLHDPKTGQRISPIQSLPGALAPMELHNSPLSEIACLGFEYGYSMEAPETLVLWEAQFGDFVNSAQVIIDQFIVSALSKWGQTTRLTLLLPHGYEGSGPEHSSGAPGALPDAGRRGQHPRREPHDAGAVLPPAAPPGARGQAAPAGDHDPEVAAAPAAGDVADRAPRGRRASSRCWPSRGSTRRRSRGWCSAPASSTTTSRATRRARTTRASRSPASSCCIRSRRRRSWKRSSATRTCARSCGCRRSRATWAPARTCRRACCRSCPTDIEFGYVGRPERASPGEGYPAAHTVEQTRIIRTALDLERARFR